MNRAATAVFLYLLALPLVALGQPPEMQVPWTDVAPARVQDVVRVAALGAPDSRIGRFSGRRASARDAARRRAARALHRWADNALARVHAHPLEATRVHEAIDRGLRTVDVRPLVDAGAVVVMEIEVAVLRERCAQRGLPWVD